MTLGTLLSPDRLVRASATGLTRRRMFRNAGGMALGATVLAGTLGRVEDADACTNHPAGPCDGAPICGADRCDSGENYQCDYHEAGTDKSTYFYGQCNESPGLHNCWDESGARCCDCCAHNPGCTAGPACASVGLCPASNVYMCICRG